MNSQFTAAEKPFAPVRAETVERTNRLASWRVYGFTVSLYLLAVLVTDAFFMGDANDYVDSIIRHQH